jgi:hypothetical protein
MLLRESRPTVDPSVRRAGGGGWGTARWSSPMRWLLLLLLASPAAAAEGDAILKSLADESGWTLVKANAKGGVDVYKKDIPGAPVPAFKGIKVVDADPDLLFDAILDVPAHVGLSDDIPLKRSEVLARTGNTIDFWQYLDVPGWTMANDRYWFARMEFSRDVGGQDGHHVQTWRIIDAGQYPKALATAQGIDDDAVMTPFNYGGWEVEALGGGKVRMTFRTMSDPGGKLPKSAQNLATQKTLPDNLLQFEAEAKRRAR